jgi:gliding motility-associated-like protein
MLKTTFLLFFSLLLYYTGFNQACTTLGQTPSTAFPVCGTTVFEQKTVPQCGGTKITAPCTMGSGNLLNDKNPFWYKFTCFKAGDLGFTITPVNLGDDYDWQLWDITGRNPNDVFTDQSLFVACNWSGKKGVTGASSAGTAGAICGDQVDPGILPLFTKKPNLIQGHDYLLMISHFDTESQSGYQLKFEGGTADITDPKEPSVDLVTSGCDAMSFRVTLNKNMKCNSVAADGSDFVVTGGAIVTGAKGNNCNSSFDMNEVTITIKDPLPPGKYKVTVQKGTDGNTLKDNCDREVPVGQTFDVEILPLIPIPMDSISPVKCEPKTLNVVFRRYIQMNTAVISDFVLTGPEVRNIIGIKAVNGTDSSLSKIVQLQLDKPIQTGGTWQLQIKKGTDGNTLIDECGTEVIPGTKSFTAYDTVNANITFTPVYTCTADTVYYHHNAAHGVNSWQWAFDDLTYSSLQHPVKTYTTFTDKTVQLIVSNGVCTDSSTTIVHLDNLLDAAFTVSTDSLCPGDAVTITNTTIGNAVNWYWDFGNGITSTAKDPLPQTYSAPLYTTDNIIRLTAQNKYGCSDQAADKIRLLQSCFIAVPSAFTPNSDGRNDYLYPLNGFKASQLLFRVYNRLGQLVFETTDWNKRWDGRYKGQLQPSGTYVWTFDYTDKDSNQQFKYRGTSVLIR